MRFIWCSMVMLAACGKPVPDTLGEAYEQFGEAYCESLVDCDQYQGSVSSCSQAVYDESCASAGVNCQESADPDEDLSRGEWNDCLDALAGMTCGELDRGDTPRECT